jgi:hypothetical protein
MDMSFSAHLHVFRSINQTLAPFNLSNCHSYLVCNSNLSQKTNGVNNYADHESPKAHL